MVRIVFWSLTQTFELPVPQVSGPDAQVSSGAAGPGCGSHSISTHTGSSSGGRHRFKLVIPAFWIDCLVGILADTKARHSGWTRVPYKALTAVLQPQKPRWASLMPGGACLHA